MKSTMAHLAKSDADLESERDPVSLLVALSAAAFHCTPVNTSLFPHTSLLKLVVSLSNILGSSDILLG